MNPPHGMPPARSLPWVRRVWIGFRQILLPVGTSRYERYRRMRDAIVAWTLGPADARAVPIPVLPADAGAQMTVVVLSLDAPAQLRAAVESLTRQLPRPEIVVVNSGRPGAAERIRHLDPAVVVVECRRRLLPGAARNVGIAASRGRYVAFLASDCVALPGWIAHRLAAHRAGAAVVSTPVVNRDPLNPFATASHLLLFSTRLPGAPAARRKRYGCSYVRSLFERHGPFRSDLRVGEDTEFNDRLLPETPMRYVPAARTAHRGPRTPWHFLYDQYLRGRRSALGYLDLGGKITPEKVAANVRARQPELVRNGFTATPGPGWFALAWSLPWVRLGTEAYARGALSVRTRPPRTRSGPANDAPALLALLQLRNERRYLADYLENVAPHVDGILVLDDGSDDGGTGLLEGHPKVLEILRLDTGPVHRWDELRNRRLLVDAAARHRGRWLVAIDADERVEHDFRAKLDAILARADRDGVMAFQLRVRELWDAPDQYRVDGVWGRKGAARLFRLRADHDFGAQSLHGHWAPLNSRLPNGRFAVAEINLYHLRMVHAEDRRRRRDRYNAMDPDRAMQKIGYDYLTDVTGLALEKLPPGREYVPLRAPAPGPGVAT